MHSWWRPKHQEMFLRSAIWMTYMSRRWEKVGSFWAKRLACPYHGAWDQVPLRQATCVMLYHFRKKESKLSEIRCFSDVWLVSGTDLFQSLVCFTQKPALYCDSPCEWVMRKCFGQGSWDHCWLLRMRNSTSRSYYYNWTSVKIHREIPASPDDSPTPNKVGILNLPLLPYRATVK